METATSTPPAPSMLKPKRVRARAIPTPGVPKPKRVRARTSTELAARIYNYGALEPTENLDIVLDQLKKNHEYRNALVQLELERRARFDALLHSMFPEIVPLHAAMVAAEALNKELYAQVKKINAKARKNAASAELIEKSDEAFDAMKAAQNAHTAVRKKCIADPQLQAAANGQNEFNKAATRELRGKHGGLDGVYWGTYLLAEAIAKQQREGPPPHFASFKGHGRVGVQLQKGLKCDQLYACNSPLLKMTPPASNAWDRGQPRSAMYLKVHMRIHSTEKGRPIWTTIPIKYHRPLPAGCVIKRCWLLRRRIADVYRWFMQFSIVMPKDMANYRVGASEGRVGVDVGWRLVPSLTEPGSEDLRVAKWAGSDGQVGELCIPRAQLERVEHVEYLQGQNQLQFNDMHERLMAWIASQQQLPDWFKEATQTIGHWRSSGSLARLVRTWNANRFAGDEAITAELDHWYQDSSRTYREKCFLDRRVRMWRQNFYSHFAIDIMRCYKVACVEDANWAAAQNEKRKGNKQKLPPGSKENRNIAAVAEIRDALKARMEVIERRSAYTTMVHHQCGQLSGEINRASLMHTCQHCGQSYDQDLNAAFNLLNDTAAPVAQELAVAG